MPADAKFACAAIPFKSSKCPLQRCGGSSSKMALKGFKHTDYPYVDDRAALRLNRKAHERRAEARKF